MEKEIKITPPEGYEIDKENSTFECIKFKPVQKKRWRNNEDAQFGGYFIQDGTIKRCSLQWNVPNSYDIFSTKKLAKSALAMARISQIMANDERFGGPITDEEWKSGQGVKHVIRREGNHISDAIYYFYYHFIAFHTREQRDLFLKENEDLVKDYLML